MRKPILVVMSFVVMAIGLAVVVGIAAAQGDGSGEIVLCYQLRDGKVRRVASRGDCKDGGKHEEQEIYLNKKHPILALFDSNILDLSGLNCDPEILFSNEASGQANLVYGCGSEAFSFSVPNGAGGERRILGVSDGLLELSGKDGAVLIKPEKGQMLRANDGTTELFNFAQSYFDDYPQVFFGSPNTTLSLQFVDSKATFSGGGIRWDGDRQRWSFSGDDGPDFLKISDGTLDLLGMSEASEVRMKHYSQDEEPPLQEGAFALWEDTQDTPETDDDKYYMIWKVGVTQLKIEFTP